MLLYQKRLVSEGKLLRTQESEETYLETIYMLGKGGNAVRSVDIANELSYSRASISVAMKNLREKKLIEVESNGHINLTNEGQSIAISMYERHTLISEWLVSLGVSRETAERDACKMEHSISDESFAAIKHHIEKS
jgi:Mn-dependent DtxR family transcriptional regulator